MRNFLEIIGRICYGKKKHRGKRQRQNRRLPCSECNRMQIPSKEQCYQIMCNTKMMRHIAGHCLQVCHVAMLIAEGIQEVTLNRDLIQASALLHDITKTRSIETGESHALTGARLLIDLGYPEVGNAVGQHVELNKYFASKTPSEAEIVNYADKRVLHDKVVSLSERMDYILFRYGKKPEHQDYINWLWKKTEELEDRLFGYLTFSPEELNGLVAFEDYSTDFSEYGKVCAQLDNAIPGNL